VDNLRHRFFHSYQNITQTCAEIVGY